MKFHYFIVADNFKLYCIAFLLSLNKICAILVTNFPYFTIPNIYYKYYYPVLTNVVHRRQRIKFEKYPKKVHNGIAMVSGISHNGSMPDIFTSECSIRMYIWITLHYLLNFAQTKIGRVYVGI